METICVPGEATPKLTTFVAKLKKLTDKRDNRGKRHELDFVLAGVVLAIMSGRYYTSSIHRFIVNRIDWLCDTLGRPAAKAVSRAQLPRILAGVEWNGLNEIVFAQFGVKIEVKGKEWHALDGKTLRGIPGQKDRVLLAVSHTERKIVAQKPLQGAKESEITAVREMLAETGLEKGDITLDALHFNPKTTKQSHQAGGRFVIQLKDNQPTLFGQMSQEATAAVPLGTVKSSEKSRGRLEIRQATFFNISHLKLDPRWDQSGLNTLIVMSRRTTEVAKEKSSAEVSFYCSNALFEPGDEQTQQELFIAIRKHWGIESDNYIRDVSFKEDAVRTKSGNQGQVLVSLRTLAISLFREAKIDNFQAALEKFCDCPEQFEVFLKQYRFL